MGALRSRLGKVFRLHVRDGGRITHPYAALKVEIQTAVIEIDRSNHGAAVIGDERFGVHHAGGVLIDLHTRENERFVVGAGHFTHKRALSLIAGVTMRTSTPDLAAAVSAVIISLSMMR